MDTKGVVIKLDKKGLSQLDPGGVLKSAHDDQSQALRVVSSVSEVPSSYSRVELVYNIEGSVTRATFYEGILNEQTEITCLSDVGGSLNSKYFLASNVNSQDIYYFWFNVNNTGIDPLVPNAIGIEIPIQMNDNSQVIALAIELATRPLKDFKATRRVAKVLFENVDRGVTDPLLDVNTGFVLTQLQAGTERLIKDINIPYVNNVRYIYNEQEKKFDVESTQPISVEVDVGDTISISAHADRRIIRIETNFLANTLSTSAYIQVLNYVATENIRIRSISIKADTFGSFKFKIDSNVKDYFQTSQLVRNCRFEFLEEEDWLTGEDLKIEFLPDRLQGVSNYNFFMKIEGYKV